MGYRKYMIKGIEVNVDPYLWDNVQTGKDLIAAKFDNVLAIDGMEGTGKSELAFQWAIIQSEGEFSEKDIFYTADQFDNWIRTAKKGSVGVWDEFVLAGMSTDALTKMQNAIIKQFTIMRSKGLTVILVIPYFFMLRKYFAVARTRALIHVFAEGLERGYLQFFNYKKKHYIYNYGQKTWLYSPKVLPNFYCRFPVWSDKFINHDLIADKKEKALLSINENKSRHNIAPTEREAEIITEVSTIKVFKTGSSKARQFNRYKKKIKDFYQKTETEVSLL